jgi:2,4-dienoyl-CoA reductase-like NADH-dependent reductase (Old Yellow Enzyme family)
MTGFWKQAAKEGDSNMHSLRDEIVIKGLRLRNRIVLPPLTTNYGSLEGYVTDAVIQFYTERARDVGLVIVEATAVQPDGRIVPGSLGLWEDGQIAGMGRLAAAIKGQGAAAVVQLNHAGARCTPAGGELQGASPSGVAFRPDVAPFAMSQEQISSMVMAFADAARRAAQAGFDGVEIHGAHMYLISQFLSPFTNHRDDRYGGDAAARATFAREVVRVSRDSLGREYPILFRLNAIEDMEGGQTLADALVVGRLMANEGVDALDVSLVSGCTWREVDGRRFPICTSAFSKKRPPGANVSVTAELKAAAGLPVIAVGKLGEEMAAAEAVRTSGIDMIAIGRQMIADPHAAGKILSGRGNEINRCDECMTCFASLGQGKPLVCKVNKGLPGSHAS